MKIKIYMYIDRHSRYFRRGCRKNIICKFRYIFLETIFCKNYLRNLIVENFENWKIYATFRNHWAT